MLVVVGARGRTMMAQGLVVRRVGWVEVLEGRSTGLVPGFAAYPSSTTVESERVRVLVVVREGVTHLSVDEDAVEDVGSKSTGLKRWVVGCSL